MQTHLWNPWSVFDELERSMFATSSASWPQFDIEDSEDETILSADMPGMTDDDIDVTVQGHYVTIRGERRARNGRYLRRARFHGTFERTFYVGEQYDLDQVDAHLVNGELTLRLRKTAKAKPRKVKLGSGLAAKVKGLLGVEKEKDKEKDRNQHAA
jgi:HSP20 family protein